MPSPASVCDLLKFLEEMHHQGKTHLGLRDAGRQARVSGRDVVSGHRLQHDTVSFVRHGASVVDGCGGSGRGTAALRMRPEAERARDRLRRVQALADRGQAPGCQTCTALVQG